MAAAGRSLAADDVESGAQHETEALLGPDSDEEEDFFLRGPQPNSQSLTDSNIGRVKSQIREVTDTMRQNVERLNERGASLDELEDRSASLSLTSDEFRAGAGILRKKAQWRKLRLRIIIGVMATAVILIIFLPIIWKSSSN